MNDDEVNKFYDQSHLNSKIDELLGDILDLNLS
jgi:hypothetical protein